MATVSERSREILEKLRDVFKDSTLAADMTLESATAYCDERYAAIIEQALLAERRLAMEECAEIAQSYEKAAEKYRIDRFDHLSERAKSDSVEREVAAFTIAKSIRAAAEKEVSK
jgi:hypothetical protein